MKGIEFTEKNEEDSFMNLKVNHNRTQKELDTDETQMKLHIVGSKIEFETFDTQSQKWPQLQTKSIKDQNGYSLELTQ